MAQRKGTNAGEFNKGDIAVSIPEELRSELIQPCGKAFKGSRKCVLVDKIRWI